MVRSGFLFLACVVAAVVAIFLGGQRAVAGPTFADPLHDTFGATPVLDLTSLSSSLAGGTLTLKLTLNGAVASPANFFSPAALYAVVYLDTDQNPATGIPSASFDAGPVGLGVDYYVDFLDAVFNPGFAGLYQAGMPLAFATVPLVFSGNMVSMQIALHLIQDDGILNYGATVSNIGTATDNAPNSGALVPTTLVPEPSSLVFFSVGALAVTLIVAAGTRRSQR